MGILFRRLRARIRYRHFERDLAEELDFHREMKETALASDGVPEEDARWQAKRELGNATLAREDARRVWIASWLESVAQDVRYALRNVRKHPGFTVTAVGTLVLGIGLTSGVFTVFNAVALRPWPVAHPRTLVLLHPQRDAQGRFSPVSRAEVDFLREHATSFAGLASVLVGGVSLPGDSEFDLTGIGFVTTNFFGVIGVGAERGRTFAPSDAKAAPGAPALVVISDRLWRNRFAEDPAIIGRTIPINKQPFTIVGVAARGLTGLEYRVRIDLYVPLEAHAILSPGGDPWPGDVIGRLAPGVSRARAQAEIDTLAYRFRTASHLEPRSFRITGTSAIEQPGGAKEFAALALIQAAVFLVLLVACSNVGNLQLARTLARRREIGIRMSIGAGRWRVVRQLVTESLMLSVAAGGLALVAAYVLPIPVLRVLVAEPRAAGATDPLAGLQPDSRVLVFTAVISLLATIASGLLPAIRATKPATATPAADGTGIATGRMRLRTVLLAAQVALSTVLLVCAGLLTHGITRTLSQGLDVRTKDVVIAQMAVDAQSERADADESARAVVEAMQASFASPVAVTEVAPVRYNSVSMLIRLPGESTSVYRQVRDRPVSNGYFAVLGIPLVSGRLFGPDASARGEAIVNETFARTVWPGRSAVGQTFLDARASSGSRTRSMYMVVGVVRDCHETGPGDIPPVLHTAAESGRFSNLLVRGEPGLTAAKMRAIAAGVDPRIKMTIAPLSDYLRGELAIPMLGAGVAWAIGLLGLALAIVGVFGVFAYVVEERKREIGIRIALGARGAQVVRIIFGQTRMATLGGLGAGLLLSIGTAQLLRAYLFGTSPFDPVAYAGIALLLAASAAVASYVPARRASRIDPAVTLRCE